MAAAIARCLAAFAVSAGALSCTEPPKQTASPAEPGDRVAAAPRTEQAPAPAGGGGAVVVELFTSEGCSSCPPADALLRELAGDLAGPGVLALSFHVDYWNELGWPDPFSLPAYTRRQEAYARTLGGGSGMYTPEMVVSGRDAFVGSDRGHALRSIDSARARAGKVKVDVQAARAEGRAVTGAWSVQGAGAGAHLNVALAERGVVSKVPRGENAGRTLQHENVVRAFQTVPLDRPAGTVRLAAPPGADLGRASLVVYVQDPTTMEILGAANAEVGN